MMRRIAIVLVILVAMLLPMVIGPNIAVAAPVQISTTTINTPIASGYTGDKNFWCNDRLWAVWYDGSHMVWSSSSDNGATWAAKANLLADAFYGAEECAVWADTDNTSIHVAYSNWDATNSALYYRKGNLDAAGTITWAEVAQTAVAAAVGVVYVDISITTLAGGEPLIGYLYGALANTNKGKPYVTLSSTDNGAWTVAAGYPYEVNSGTTYGAIEVAAFSTGDFYVLYGGGATNFLYGRNNDIGGAGWAAFPTVLPLLIAGGYFRNFDVTVQADDGLHVCAGEQGGSHLYYMYKAYEAAWSSSVLLSETYLWTTFQISALSDNNLIIATVSTAADNGYYLMRCAGVWDTSWTELWNEAVDATDLQMSIPFNNNGNHWFMVYWTEHGATDYIMFEDIVAPVVTTMSDDAGVTKVTMYGTCNSTSGSEGANVRFNYGLTTAYGDNTSWQHLATADNFSAYKTGLTASTIYHYRAEAYNSFGWVYGADENFTTEASISPPTALIAIPVSAYEISTSWQIGDLASSSELRYSLTGYPAYGAGTLLYSGTAQSFFMDNATAGTTYYFAVWCWEVDEPVSTSDNAMATTPAGYPPADTPTDTTATEPYSTVIDTTPMAGLISFVSTYGQLPRATVGMIIFAAVFGAVLMGVAIYNRSMLVMAIVGIAGLMIGNRLGLIAMIFVALAAIVAFALARLRGGQENG